VSRRASDRWVTPWVVCVLILAGTLVVLAVLGCVTYLTARGFDPEPVVQLVGTLVAAATGTGTFLLSLVKRKTDTKVERNVGVLGNAVVSALEELEAERGRHARGAEVWPASSAPRTVGQDSVNSEPPRRRPASSSEGYSQHAGEDLRDTAWFRQ
jgi:hypothetical protein